MLNLDIESTDEACSIVNNLDRALAEEKVVVLGSKDFDTINNSDIYNTYKDLYLSEKEREEKLLQGISRLKITRGCKKGRWHDTDSDNPVKRA